MYLGIQICAYLSPARRAPAVLVLDQQVGSADLSLWHGNSLGSCAGASAVVGGHVVLQLLGVGSRGRLPA